MLVKRITPLAFVATLVASLAIETATMEKVPLLTAISRDPDLSIFYSLLNSTGGSTGLPGPPFEERFNSLVDGRKYTAFAPVNSAFEGLRTGIPEALTAPAAYPLLEAILRTHIAEGLVTSDDVRKPGVKVTSIEGIPLRFTTQGNDITINDDNQAKLVSTSSTAVGNGAIFKLTKILDPFVQIFGSDIHTNTTTTTAPIQPSPNTPADPSTPPNIQLENTTTILSVLLATTPLLSTYTSVLRTLAPDFCTLLDTPLPKNKNITIFAPSDTAFKALGGTASTLQPSNQALSAYLLKYGVVDTTVVGREISLVGFPTEVRRDSKGKVTGVNNVEGKGERRCAGGVCVVVVERWVDPVFGLF